MADANEEKFLKVVFLLMKYGTTVLQQRIIYELRNTRWQRLPAFLEEIKHRIFHLMLSKECCAGNCKIPKKSYIHRDVLGLMYENVDDCCSKKFIHRCCCKFVPKSDLDTVKSWDITLTSCLLLEFLIEDRGQRKVVENIRDLRNNKELLHRGNAEMDSCMFDQIWLKLSNAIKEMAEKCEPHFYREICESVDGLKTSPLTEDNQRTSWKFWELTKNEFDVQAQTHQISEKVTEVSNKLSDLTIQRGGQQSDPEMENLLHFSEMHMKVHQSKVYIEPRKAMRHCVKLLDKHRFICLTGDAGSGKTHFGLQLMGNVKKEHQDAIVLVLTKSSQWFRFVSKEKKFVLFVDDILGKSNVSERSFEKWSKVFDAMHLRISDRNFPVFIIFSFRNCIWGLMKEKLMDYVLFNMYKTSSSPVDLSGLDFGMTDREKKRMLREFCILHRISVCESLYLEDRAFESLDQNDLCLCEQTLNNIAKMKTVSGFPLLCEDFFSNPESLKQRSTFFLTRSALSHFKKQVDDLLVKDKYLNYALLVFLFLQDKALSLDSVWKFKKEIEKIAEGLGLPRHGVVLNKARIRGCLEDMNIFLSSSDEGYRIRHMVVYEAILLSFGENFPEMFLERIDKSVIFTYVRSQNYVSERWEICMHLEMDMTKQFAEKLIGLYTPNSADAYTDVYKHRSFNDDALVSCFLEVVKEDDRFKTFLGSFVAGACMNKKDKLASETIRTFNDRFHFDFEIFEVVVDYDLIHTFQKFIDNSEFKELLLQKLQSEEFCTKFLRKACQSGSRDCFLGTLSLLDESRELETDGDYSCVISTDTVESLLMNIIDSHNEAPGADWRDVLSKLVELVPSEIDQEKMYRIIISNSLVFKKLDIAQEYLDLIVSLDSSVVFHWICYCFMHDADAWKFFSALITKVHGLNLMNELLDREKCASLAIFGARCKHESMVMKLLDEFECDYRSGRNGETILHSCEENMFSDANLVTILRKSGPEVMFNRKNYEGPTPVQCRPSYPGARKFRSYPWVRKSGTNMFTDLGSRKFHSMDNLHVFQHSKYSDNYVHRLRKTVDDMQLLG